MAIIKCPECQHEVSDMARQCPFCGVDIAGNLIICPDCGKTLLKTTQKCPNCSCDVSSTPAIPSTFINSVKTEETNPVKNLPEGKKEGKWGKKVLVTLIVVLVLGLSAGGYFYYRHISYIQQLDADHEALANNYDIEAYRSFLEKYPESVYTQEIKDKITLLQKIQEDWQKIEASSSRNDFALFLQHYPQSGYTQVCENKLDSLDWLDANGENTQEAYTQYIKLHPQGKYAELANKSIEDLDKLVASPDEKNTIRNLIQNYFSALGSRNTEEMAGILTSKQYEQTISFMNAIPAHTSYSITSNINVSKIPSKQLDVYNFVAKYQVEKQSKEDENYVVETYNVSTIIYPDMRISIMRFNKAATVPAQE